MAIIIDDDTTYDSVLSYIVDHKAKTPNNLNLHKIVEHSVLKTNVDRGRNSWKLEQPSTATQPPVKIMNSCLSKSVYSGEPINERDVLLCMYMFILNIDTTTYWKFPISLSS
ncbi:hypothetical protein MTR_2g016170 [Medicago truncatula]|uniref:Uncharacterized protein n=1 Tax=Medicago truncatula TaxID=3880 RepID=A0A072V5F8_MEDTR|nr:hypothetical protein MTR_2g016170 [Medicago truncatula]